MTADASWAATERRRLPLGRLTAFIVGTLFLAGAIHIGAILLVPRLAAGDSWARLNAVAASGHFAEITPPGAGPASVPGLDPLFVNGACRVDLRAAPAEITLSGGDRFWSVSLYEPDGASVFSLNDRTAVGGKLDMLVATPAQYTDLQSAGAAGTDQKIVVQSPADDLVALVRLFAPTRAVQEDVRRALAGAGCSPAPQASSGQSSGG